MKKDWKNLNEKFDRAAAGFFNFLRPESASPLKTLIVKAVLVFLFSSFVFYAFFAVWNSYKQSVREDYIKESDARIQSLDEKSKRAAEAAEKILIERLPEKKKRAAETESKEKSSKDRQKKTDEKASKAKDKLNNINSSRASSDSGDLVTSAELERLLDEAENRDATSDSP